MSLLQIKNQMGEVFNDIKECSDKVAFLSRRPEFKNTEIKVLLFKQIDELLKKATDLVNLQAELIINSEEYKKEKEEKYF